MENEEVPANTSRRAKPIRMVYIVVLSCMDIILILLMMAAFVTGTSQEAAGVFLSIYPVILYLFTGTSFYLNWNLSLVYYLLSLWLILTTSISLYGFISRKKWGRMANLLFLVFVFPEFIVLPTAFLWRIPPTRYIFSIGAICPLAIGLLIFNIYYFFWFLRKKEMLK
jgi:hypothetical protein